MISNDDRRLYLKNISLKFEMDAVFENSYFSILSSSKEMHTA